MKRQSFNVGQEVLMRAKENGNQWLRVEITGIRLISAGGGRYQRGEPTDLEFSYRAGNGPGYHSPDKTFRESEAFIVHAVPDPHRDCWKGSPELTRQHEMQLFFYDFGLDGADSAITASITGKFVSGPSGTDFDHHAKVVFDLSGEMIDSKVSVNLWRLIDFGVDTQTLWKYTAGT